MQPLPNWVLPPTMPSIYESESMTALEAVARLHGAMKQLIDEYNEFVTALQKEQKSFISSSSTEFENLRESVEKRLACKFKDLDANIQAIRMELKRYTDTALQKAFDVFGVTVKEAGESLQLVDATDEKIRGLTLYGKTTQSWEPVPEYPAQLQSVGDAGSVVVKIANGTEEQKLTIATPEGLPGIPVSEGGNYTDATGQKWICDEIDLNRGVNVQRVVKETISGAPNFTETADVPGRFMWKDCFKNATNGKLTCLSNFASWTAWGIGTEAKVYFCVTYNHLYFVPATAMTADEVNALFAEMIASGNPPVVLLQLSEPVERPLTTAELAAYKQLHTYMPDTAVTTDSGAGILLEYVAIMQKFMDKIIPEYTAAAVNEAIRNGQLVVATAYDPETENLDIITGGV